MASTRITGSVRSTRPQAPTQPAVRRNTQRAIAAPTDQFQPARRSASPVALAAPQVQAAAAQAEVWGPGGSITNTNAAYPVDAPIQGDPNARSADVYSQVINQFDVENNPRYAQRDGNTYCNIFAWDVTRAMGTEIPHWVDNAGNPMPYGQGHELDANGVNQWLNSQGGNYGWQEVSPDQAQAMANQGFPVVASWDNVGDIGHIAVVRPGAINGNGPETAQAGGENWNDGHVYDSFPRGAQVQYFVNTTGQVAQPKPSGDPAVTQLVTDAYHNVLRRDPDQDGLNNWNNAAQSMAQQGKSKGEIASWLNDQFQSSVEAQALRLTDQTFQQVLGRDVSGSRGYWHEQAVTMMRDQGKSADEVKAFLTQNLMNSKEYALGHVDQVVSDTFQQELGRADTNDDYWHQVGRQMANDGKSLDDIRGYLKTQFDNSTEYKLDHVDQLVSDTFQQELGRPDTTDDYWHQVGRQMVQDGKSLDEIQGYLKQQFDSSEEYRLNHPEQTITQLYQQLLNRAPDPEGMKTWTDYANQLKGQGKSADQIRDAIADQIKGSPEYLQLHPTGDVSNLPKTGNAFIDSHVQAAIEAQRKTGVPASLTLAQALIESGAGQSSLAATYNNYFGIKGSGTAGSVSLPTTEYVNGSPITVNADFAVYNNAEESFEAHGQLIAGTHPGWTPYYAVPWAQYQQDHDAYALARGIAHIYATDPNYAETITNVMQQYDLTRFDNL